VKNNIITQSCYYILLYQIFHSLVGIICIMVGQTIRLLKYGIKMAYTVENINDRDRSFKYCHEEYPLSMLLCKCFVFVMQIWLEV
jgi:hypothetical protein